MRLCSPASNMPARLCLVGGKRRAQRPGSERSDRRRLAVQPRANRPRTYRRLATIRRRDRHIHGDHRWLTISASFRAYSSRFVRVGGAADAIRGELAAELDRHEGAALGFEDGDRPRNRAWRSLDPTADEYGEPEHVTRFVLRCAEAFDLEGAWGFCWSLTCFEAVHRSVRRRRVRPGSQEARDGREHRLRRLARSPHGRPRRTR